VPIRIALGQTDRLTSGLLKFAQQVGAKGVILQQPPLSADSKRQLVQLRRLCARAAGLGLRVEAIENLAGDGHRRLVRYGPSAVEEIAAYSTVIQNMGAAGIPILGVHWMADGAQRTSFDTPGRGGAAAMAFDQSDGKEEGARDRELSATAARRNLDYFLATILPIAEHHGVQIALHPDDPPLPALHGFARVLNSFDNFESVLSNVDSPNLKLNFCVGSWASMGGDPIRPLRYYLERGRIAYAHIRNVRGSVPSFVETFIDEGDVDIAGVVNAMKDFEFDGAVIDDHVPRMDQSANGYDLRSHAYAVGYLRGLIAASHGSQGRS
jgi:mannonate dehydratase